MNSSAHIDNKKKDIVILGKSPTNGLDDTTLTAKERMFYKFAVEEILFKFTL